MKHLQQSIKFLFALVFLTGFNQVVSAQITSYLIGRAMMGEPITIMNGDIAIAPTGELFLGAHSPRGLQTNLLYITGDYIGEEGSRIYTSVTDNSNIFGTRGYIDIVGTATKTTGATTIILDMFDNEEGWDGSYIDLIRAYNNGSDAGTFRMDEMPQSNGRIAILRCREYGYDMVWYIGEKLIFSQNTNAQSVSLDGVLEPLSVETAKDCRYQWYSCDADGSNLVDLGDVNGAQTASFTPSSETEGTSYYYCVVSSIAGNNLEECHNTETTAVSGAISVVAEVGISKMQDMKSLPVAGYYSILGQKLPKEPENGIYIIKYENGKTEKIVK